jgi:hypothetical protein
LTVRPATVFFENLHRFLVLDQHTGLFQNAQRSFVNVLLLLIGEEIVKIHQHPPEEKCRGLGRPRGRGIYET